MMFKQVLFDDFESMLLQKLGPICMMTFVKGPLRATIEINNSFFYRGGGALTLKKQLNYFNRSNDELDKLFSWQSYCLTYDPRLGNII